MKATDILKQEHQIIKAVLHALEGIVDDATDRGKLNAEAARNAVDFIRNFADRCHHAKEEDQLFPVLEQRGIPNESGPIGVMLHDHEVGREHVRSMADAIDRAAEGDKDALNQFEIHARGYINLLRDHIHKEDNVLFRLAEDVLTTDDDANVLEQYERVESEHIGNGVHEKYVSIGRKLAEEFASDKVDFSVFETESHSCGHSPVNE